MKLSGSTRFLRTTLIGGIVAFGSHLAIAADSLPDLYVGGALSLKSSSNLGGKIDAAMASQGIGSLTSATKPGITPTIKLGYRWTPNIAFEVTYDQIGKSNLSSVLTSPIADTAAGTWKSSGLGLHVLGIAPIDNLWSMYGRLGVEQWRTTAALASNSGGPTNLNASASKFGMVLGAGVSYAVAPNVDATAEAIYYSNVGNQSSTGRQGFSALNLGLLYHFK